MRFSDGTVLGNSTEEKRNRIKRRKGDNARGSKPPQRGLREGEKALNEGYMMDNQEGRGGVAELQAIQPPHNGMSKQPKWSVPLYTHLPFKHSRVESS